MSSPKAANTSTPPASVRLNCASMRWRSSCASWATPDRNRRMKTTLHTPAPGIWERLVKQFKNRPDSEFQQALIRVAIGLVFLAYFSGVARLEDSLRGTAQMVSAVFTGIAVLIATLSLASQKASPPRRIVAMSLDYATCSFLLTYTGEAGSPLLVVYLWVTLGNGFRYGVAYLYAATAM